MISTPIKNISFSSAQLSSRLSPTVRISNASPAKHLLQALSPLISLLTVVSVHGLFFQVLVYKEENYTDDLIELFELNSDLSSTQHLVERVHIERMDWSLLSALLVLACLVTFVIGFGIIQCLLKSERRKGHQTLAALALIWPLSLLFCHCFNHEIAFPLYSHLFNDLPAEVARRIDDYEIGLQSLLNYLYGFGLAATLTIFFTAVLMLTTPLPRGEKGLEVLHKRVTALRTLLYSGSVVLVLATATIQRTFDWITNLSPEGVAEPIGWVATSVTSIWTVMFALTLASAYVPTDFLLKEHARSIVDRMEQDFSVRKEQLAKYELVFAPQQRSLPRIFAVIAPLLTGLSSELLKLIG